MIPLQGLGQGSARIRGDRTRRQAQSLKLLDDTLSLPLHLTRNGELPAGEKAEPVGL